MLIHIDHAWVIAEELELASDEQEQPVESDTETREGQDTQLIAEETDTGTEEEVASSVVEAEKERGTRT